MKRNPILSGPSVVLGLAALCALVHGAEFQFPTQTIMLADGFEIQLIAGPPLVDRPIMADFDERGRLYVADSSGSSDKVDKQLAEKPHRIVRLEDTDGDGRFDKRTVFADKMMFPEGILWHDGAVYSAAPPSIWKLEDTDDDGVADKRTEWFKGVTLTGCANDLHGPYLGPDGYIYWCKGAFAKQTHERPGRKTISDSAAHIFRCRPDGSDFDSVMSGGMDNPVEVAFTTSGDPFFTTTFFVNPGGGQRDAIVHAVYGAVFPKVHGVLDGLKRTGELLPPLTHLGPAVPSGLMRYASSAFGAEYQDNLFSSQFNMHRIQRHVLEPMGSAFRSRDLDFLVSDNPDFHPTDLLEDADGSLIVIDTGGWYKLCCPSSQIGKPEVLGAIYRVRRTGAPKVNDPRGLKLEWNKLKAADLVKLLDDRRPAVQQRAIHQLGKLGDTAVSALKGARRSESVVARRNAIWTLTRIDSTSSREAVRAALQDRDATVQQAAVHSTGLRRDAAALPALLQILKSGSPSVRRAVASALAQIADKSAVPALLAASSIQHDRMLEHSLVYALIEIGDREGTAAGLRSESPFTRRAALIALDQMDDGRLASESVVPLLNSSNPALKETAAWIASHHPDWGKDLIGFFKQQLSSQSFTDPSREELQKQLAQFGRDPSIQQFMVNTLADSATPKATRVTLLHAMAQTPLREAPATWLAELPRCLADGKDQDELRAGLAIARALPAAKTNANALVEALLRVASTEAHPADLRLEALSALPAGLTRVSAELFGFLTKSLEPGQPLYARSTAATILGRAKLDDVQLLQLTKSIKTAGPFEVSKLFAAFETTTNEGIGRKLVEALKQSRGLAALRPEVLKARLAKFPPNVQQQGDELIRMLGADLAKQQARLEDLQTVVASGDKGRGHLIFNSAKAACATCHAIGYRGGQVGPDLTRIGSVRTERDLLESIVYPSASFVRSYEPVIVSTNDGEEHSGVLRDETAETLHLVQGANNDMRIARENVKEIRPGVVSVMPAGLDETMTRQELADLVAFLKSLK